MDNYLTLRLDRDWHKKKPSIQEGAIYKFIGQDWRIDEQHVLACFELIGHPVKKETPITFVYN